MNAYLDSSVVLRVVLQAPRALDWKTIEYPISSVLLQIECLRTVDRLQLTGNLKTDEISRTYRALHAAIEKVELLHVTADTIARAGQSFGVPLKTLDAIHLGSALAWREAVGENLTFATHDTALAEAARSMGFDVLGA